MTGTDVRPAEAEEQKASSADVTTPVTGEPEPASAVPPTTEEEDGPSLGNLVITPGELFAWNGTWWRIVSQVQVPLQGGKAITGLVVVPTEPTNGAMKRWAAGKKAKLRRQKKLAAAGRVFWPTKQEVRQHEKDAAYEMKRRERAEAQQAPEGEGK